MNYSTQKYSLYPIGRPLLAALFGIVLMLGLSSTANAQALGWEGETGVFVTPLAYTASAEGQKFHPVVAYHYLNAGSVIGDFHEVSIEMGVGKRFEFGYTREYHTFGGNATLSPLWQDGFDIFNAKVNVVPENYFKKNWVPQVSVGVIGRTGVRNVGDYVSWTSDTGKGRNNDGKHNFDVYLVGSKTVPVKHAGPFVATVLSAGVRGTNSELWGMGGNAPDWDARGFGAIAFAFKAPRKSTLIFASEASQQPHHPGMNGTAMALNIPTTLTYAARFIPTAKYKLNFDVGVAQIAGQIAPGTDLKARHQVGVQVSYGF